MKLKIHIEDLLLMLGDFIVDADATQVCRLTERILGLEPRSVRCHPADATICELNLKTKDPTECGITDELLYRYNIKEDTT